MNAVPNKTIKFLVEIEPSIAPGDCADLSLPAMITLAPSVSLRDELFGGIARTKVKSRRETMVASDNPAKLSEVPYRALVSCEHASNAVPDELNQLGLDELTLINGEVGKCMLDHHSILPGKIVRGVHGDLHGVDLPRQG